MSPVPSSYLTYSQSRILLLRLHTHLLSLYAPALIPASFPTRLLRHALTALHPVLPQRNSQIGFGTVESGKRGKKRARGGEDGLVGTFEGRAARALGSDEIEVALAALQREFIIKSFLADEK